MTPQVGGRSAPRAAIECQARGRGIDEDLCRSSHGVRGVGLAGAVLDVVEDLHGA